MKEEIEKVEIRIVEYYYTEMDPSKDQKAFAEAIVNGDVMYHDNAPSKIRVYNNKTGELLKSVNL